ncbi:MAG: hypothetical protein J6R96_08025 [Spirochaetaceae bacterium]|nr:hypothetical protein [Spirochaetaceae bacterium]
MDYPDTEEISRYSGERLLSSLEVNSESPAFYRVLTVAQRERILSTLDTMMAQEKEVLVEGTYSVTLSRSAKAAVTILIYSSPLVYDIIYNFANPALSALTLSGISMEELYVVYTDSIKYFLLHGIQGALEEMAFAFYNLYRISNYYNEAVKFAPFGVYSGGDLQNYLLSGILGGLIRSTQNLVSDFQQDYQEIAEAVSEIYYQLVNAGTVDSQLLESLFNLLAQKLQIPLEEILSGYMLELDFVAGIFEAMANNAGYNLMAQDTARTIRSWGN